MELYILEYNNMWSYENQRPFVGTCRLHQRGRRISQEKKNNVKHIANRITCLLCACFVILTGFFLGLFLDTEDGGDMFLWNVGRFPTHDVMSRIITVGTSKPNSPPPPFTEISILPWQCLVSYTHWYGPPYLIYIHFTIFRLHFQRGLGLNLF
jgi:hypothetical protein